MLGRISRGFGHSGKQSVKYRLNVFVEKLDNLPGPVKKCRVVWSRGPKVQMTDIKDVAKGAVSFKQQLSQIATMYKDPKQGFEPKEYTFQVQVPGNGNDGKLMTVGKANIDLSFFVLAEGQPQNKLIPILFKVGAASTGYLKVVITAEVVAGDVDDDGMTEVSGMTGIAHLTDDQDLSGFDDEAAEADEFSKKASPRPAAGSATKRASRLAGSTAPTPSTAAAAELKLLEAKEQQQGLSAGRPSSSQPSSSSKASLRAAATAAADDDEGDVSPLSLSPSTSEPTSPREPVKPGNRGAGKVSNVSGRGAGSAAAKDARAELFSTGASAAASSSKATAGRGMSRSSSRSIPDMTEDEARSELFSRGSAGTSGRRAAASRSAGKASSSDASQPLPAAAGPSKPAAADRAGAARSNSSNSSLSQISASAGSATGGGGAIRRSLLDRPRLEPPAAAAAIASSSAAAATEVATSSKAAQQNKAPAGAAPVRKHSLSESDDEDGIAASGSLPVQPLKAPASRPSAASRIPHLSENGAKQAQGSTAAAGAAKLAAAAGSGDGADSAASKQLAADNEKLRAQLAALRDQAAQAEDARRQAWRAAENATSERDDYRTQAKELQDQLKEAIMGMITPEEGEELQQQVQQLQLQVQQQREQLQQQQHNQDLELDHGDIGAWQQKCIQLEQQLADAEGRADQLLQQLDSQRQHTEAQLQQHLQHLTELEREQQQEQQHNQLVVTQLEQQLADALSNVESTMALATEAEQQRHQLAGQVCELTQELEATQHLLQHQQETAAQTAAPGPAAGGAVGVPALSNVIMDLRAKLADVEQRAVMAEQQRDGILALLLEEVQLASQQGSVKQHLGDKQLVAAAQESVACLAVDPGVQDVTQQVLVGLKAATATVVHQAEIEASLEDKVRVLKAALEQAEIAQQTNRPSDQQQQQQQPGMDDLRQNMAQLEAEVNQLRQDKHQLLQQQQQQQQLDSTVLAKLERKAGEVEQQGHIPLIRAGVQLYSAAPAGAAIYMQQKGVPEVQQQSQRQQTALGTANQSMELKELEQVKQQLASSRRKVKQLVQARDKLEVILQDFEAAAAEEKQQLLVQLSAANQALRQVNQQLADAEQHQAKAHQEQQRLQQCLEAALAEVEEAKAAAAACMAVEAIAPAAAAAAAGHASCAPQVIALAEGAGPSGIEEALAAAQDQVAELQKQVAESGTVRRALDAELVRLRKQLADEQAERATLEEQLAQHLEDTGDYMAQDTVAAYEAKYNRLKSRYRELTESHREEVDGLHDEIAALQERLVDLEAAAAQLEAARSQAQHGEATLAETLQRSSKASAELAALRSENQTLMQGLVSAKLELAQCSEREVVGRRELYKAKETNMKLASKMTKLETLVYKK